MNEKLTQSRPEKIKWDQLYYVLAAIELVVILATICSNVIEHRRMEELIDDDSHAMELLSTVGSVFTHAGKTNIPANDVFDSKDPKYEQGRFEKELFEFNESMNTLRELVSKEQNQAEIQRISSQVFDIDTNMKSMQHEATLVFSGYGQGKLKLAAQHMAAMDRSFSKLLLSIETLRASKIQQRSEALLKHREYLIYSHAIALVFSIVILALIVSIAWYGVKLSRVAHETAVRDAHLISIIESSDDAIISKNIDGIITSWNPGAERIFGYRPSEAIGKPITMLLPPDRLGEEATILALIGEGKGFKNYETTRVTKDGHTIFVSITLSPLKNRNTEIIGASKIIRDITKEHELRNALSAEQAKALHTSKLASLGEMSAGIAHEINNPLSIISGTVALISKMNNVPQPITNKMSTISRATERISKIVSGLRKFSRTTNEGSRKEVALSAIIQETMILCEVKAKRFSVPIKTEIHTDAHILCDEIEIEQVVINLVNNAIDAIGHCPNKWVKIVLFDANNELVLQVHDSGDGISKEIEARLFEPFFTTKAVNEGTGLGLSIVKGIVEQHKGKITLNRSFPNTCFEVRFPKIESSRKAA
jgi:PAS domain S-box-containing protein